MGWVFELVRYAAGCAVVWVVVSSAFIAIVSGGDECAAQVAGHIGVVPTTNHFGISRIAFPANLVKVAGGDVESNLLRSAPRCREGRGPRRVYPIRLVRMSHFSNETVFRLKLKRLVNVVDASPHGVHLIRHS